jgi:hypothetical protein
MVMLIDIASWKYMRIDEAALCVSTSRRTLAKEALDGGGDKGRSTKHSLSRTTTNLFIISTRKSQPPVVLDSEAGIGATTINLYVNNG